MSGADFIDIGLSDLALVKAVLQKHVPDREVWAFGSRVGGRARQFSDLDLCILGDEPLSWSVRSALSEEFSESDLPYKVDLVDWAQTAASFREVIRRGKVVIYRPADHSLE